MKFENMLIIVAGESRGVLSPQVGEISRLLGLYRPGPEGSSNITSAGTTPPMAELLTYLKDLNPEYVFVGSSKRLCTGHT